MAGTRAAMALTEAVVGMEGIEETHALKSTVLGADAENSHFSTGCPEGVGLESLLVIWVCRRRGRCRRGP